MAREEVEYYQDNVIHKMVTEASEDYDNFIFTTIQPWCEEKLQRKISKRIIEEALVQYFNKKPCEDAVVSRETVRQGMMKYGFTAPDMTVHEFVEDELPSVTPNCSTCEYEEDKDSGECYECVKGIQDWYKPKQTVRHVETLCHTCNRRACATRNVTIVNDKCVNYEPKKDLSKELELAPMKDKIDDKDFLDFLMNVINPNEMEKYISMYKSNGEKCEGVNLS